MTRQSQWRAALVLLAMTSGCGPASSPVDSGVSDAGVSPDAQGADAGPVDVPATYDFPSATAGVSSVAYDEPIARHLLADGLATTIEEMTGEIDTGSFAPAPGDVVAALDAYYGSDAAARASRPLLLTTTPETLQETFGDLAPVSLVDALPGSHPDTDHRDFSTGLVGWEDPTLAAHGGDIQSPSGFMAALFATMEANALARVDGVARPDPVTGLGDLPIEVTENGLNLGEFTQQLVLTGVSYHQVADRLLDDDVAGEGLLSDNTALVPGMPYTALEHAWDAARGCFGAARAYGTYEVADLVDGTPYADLDGDGRIDLRTEHSYKPAVYLARRDDGSAPGARTSFAADADRAFRAGRALIAGARGRALTATEAASLRDERDRILQAFEAGIAASIVHYLNAVLGQMALRGQPTYDFLEHAGAWSEMKMFAVGLQFNPHSPILARLPELHALLGDQPVLPTGATTMAELDGYAEDLRTARALLAEVYGFDSANLGDANGAGGW